MASTNKTSLGLNKWEASDKPVRQDFNNDNAIIDGKLAQLNSDLVWKRINVGISLTPTALNSKISQSCSQLVDASEILLYYSGAHDYPHVYRVGMRKHFNSYLNSNYSFNGEWEWVGNTIGVTWFSKGALTDFASQTVIYYR